MRYVCPYEGMHKVVGDDSVSKFYCKAHAEDFQKVKRTPTYLATPRKTGNGPWPCQADWPLPNEVP